MPSYVSHPFPVGTSVTVHFSHGIYQTIVLEDDENRCWPLSSAEEDVLLTDVTFSQTPMPIRSQTAVDYYGLSSVLIPLIKAKVGSGSAVAVEVRTSYRSGTLDAAMRGEGRASSLLETMPRLMARNPEAVMRGRNDGPRSPRTARPTQGTVRESDVIFRWLSEVNMCSINAISGRIISRRVDVIPDQLMVLREHPQFLIHRLEST